VQRFFFFKKEEMVKKVFSSMQIPNPIQQRNITSLAREFMNQETEKFDNLCTTLKDSLKCSRDEALFFILRN
jgi:hypothetical protein